MKKRFYVKIVLPFFLFLSLAIYPKQEKIDTAKLSPVLTNVEDLVANYQKDKSLQSDKVSKELLEEILTTVNQIKKCNELR